jgi:hypothetical protein
MEIHLKTIGIILILLSCIHPFFPRYFSWKEDFGGVSVINRQMMYVHTYFIGLIVFLIGILCLCCTSDMIHTKMGKYICFGLSVFWAIRLYCQFFVYSTLLWKGKKFETGAHIFFTCLWIYLTLIFFIIYLSPL